MRRRPNFPGFMGFLLVLLLALPAGAGELKLATWNLDWLTLRPAGDPALPADVHARAPEDFAALRAAADRLAADVVALQEVDGPDPAARLFPPDRYALHFTGDDVIQRVGFAVRRGLRFEANPDLAALVPPGERLRSGADITLITPGGRLRLLAVHLKAGCREDPIASRRRPACPLLRFQLAALQGWIAQRAAEGVPFVILGDFNRWMEPPDTFWPALQQAAPMLRATAGFSSPCWGGGRFIDHLLAGGAARAWLEPASLHVLVYRDADPALTRYEDRDRLSDHCPVSALFRLPD